MTTERKQISNDVIEDLAQAAARRWPVYRANYTSSNETYAPAADLCGELMSGYLDLLGLKFPDVERGCTSRVLRRLRELVETPSEFC